MSTILSVMAVVAAVGVVYAIQEIVQERRTNRDLRERFPDEFRARSKRR